MDTCMLLRRCVYQILVVIEKKDSCLDFARFTRARPEEAAKFFLLICIDLIGAGKPEVRSGLT